MTSVLIKDLGGATMHAVDVGGFISPNLMKEPEETKQIFDKVPDYKFQENDFMLCTYPKTGIQVVKKNVIETSYDNNNYNVTAI
jgi:hypothetical protein